MSCQAAGEEEEKVATDEDGTLAAVFLASSLFRAMPWQAWQAWLSPPIQKRSGEWGWQPSSQ